MRLDPQGQWVPACRSVYTDKLDENGQPETRQFLNVRGLGLGAGEQLDGTPYNGFEFIIGGTTSYEADGSTLIAIRTMWLGTPDFSVRVTNVRYLYLSAGVSVFDDAISDILRGDKERDWFFADRDARDGDDDALSGLTMSDKTDLL